MMHVKQTLPKGPRESAYKAGLSTARFSGLLIASLLMTAQTQSGFSQLFEDPPTVIAAEQLLTEEQNDHVEAVTLFAHGRVLLQRGLNSEGAEQQKLLPQALQRFQRAWWFDSDLVSIVEDIAPLAFRLGRDLEGTRYLIIAALREEVPLPLLAQLTSEVADIGEMEADEHDQALQLYRKLKERQAGAPNALVDFQIGRLALVNGHFQEAAEAFGAVHEALTSEADMGEATKRVREQLLKQPEVTFALFGESYLRAGQLDKAEAAFRQADQEKPDAASLAFRLALVERQRGSIVKALELLDEYFAAKTRSAGLAPYVLLSELLDGKPQPKKAENEQAADAEQAGPDLAGPADVPPKNTQPSEQLLKRLQELASADTNNPLLGYYLADVLRRAGQWEPAAEIYQRLLKQDPAADGYRGLIDIYHKQKEYGLLLEQLSEFLMKIGSLSPIDDLVQKIVTDDAALAGLVEAAASEQGRQQPWPPSGAWFVLALMQAQANHCPTAVEFFQRGLEQPFSAAGQCAVNLAFLVLGHDKADLAADLFQLILDEKLLPDRTSEVYYYLAGALTQAQQFDEALDAAREAGRLNPNVPQLLSREAWVLFQAGRLQQARDSYAGILQQFDSDHMSYENREMMRETRLALSAVEVELGNLEAAEHWLQEVLDEFPEDIGAYNDLGYLWCDQGKHLNRSLRMIQKAVAAEPDNVAYLDSLGWAFFRLGRFDDAIIPLEKAVAEEEVDAVILDHLGDVYAGANKPEKAIEVWRRALEMSDDDTRRRAIEKKLAPETTE